MTDVSFTEAKQAEMLEVIERIKKECNEKYLFYHSVHQVIENVPDFCIKDHSILPECEDLLRYLRKKRNESEVESKNHDRLIGIIKYLHPEGSLSARVCYNPDEHDEDLRGRHYPTGPEMNEMSWNAKHHPEDDGVNKA
jgi:hypothetical protein